MSSIALLFTAILSYFIPDKIFVILAVTSGFLAMFNWLTISVTHYFYRKKTLKEHPEKLKYRVPGYPYTSVFTALMVVAVLATSPLYPGQVSGLVGSVSLFVLLAVLYFTLRKLKILR